MPSSPLGPEVVTIAPLSSRASSVEDQLLHSEVSEADVGDRWRACWGHSINNKSFNENNDNDSNNDDNNSNNINDNDNDNNRLADGKICNELIQDQDNKNKI